MRCRRARGSGLAGLTGLIALAALADAAAAQIVVDGTLGDRRRIVGPDARIEASLGARRGGNLFHSFARFGVAAGESATFEAPGGVDRIVARVTGGAESRIDGAVRADGVVDLWLLNPGGIVIGPDGSVSTGVGHRLATADSLRFADGAAFGADAAAQTRLTAAAPASFGFLDRPRGRLAVEGATVDTFTRRLALEGDVVVIDGATLTTDGFSATATGDLALTGVSLLQASAEGVSLTGGRVTIRDSALDEFRSDITVTGRTVVVEDSRLGVAGITPGSTLTVRGDTVRLGARGAPGGLRIEAGALVVTDGGATGGRSPTGDRVASVNGLAIDLRAETVALSAGLLIARRIDVEADAVRLENGASALAQGADGVAAAIAIEAGRLDVSDSSLLVVTIGVDDSPGAGAPAALRIAADRIMLADGGAIGFSTFDGRSGGATVTARELMVVDGSGVDVNVFSGAGEAGVLRMDGGFLVLRDGARIEANADLGDPGAIDATGFTLLREPGTRIEAVSRSGARGAVALPEAVLLTDAEAEPLPTGFFDAFALLGDSCVAAVAGGSALRREGRGGAPFTGASQPALFGAAVGYPVATGAAPPSSPPPSPSPGRAAPPCGAAR